MMENRPAGAPASKHQTETEYWAEQYGRASGGTGRRKVRRAYKRAQDKKVVVANRRIIREHWARNSAATTLKQQLRVLDGEIGTPAQYDLMHFLFSKLSAQQGVTLASLESDLRAAVELPALAVA